MPTFIKPPRPENAIPLGALPGVEKQGWWCQFKKNGTCSIIIVSPDGTLTAFNRHGEIHKAWQFTSKSAELFKKLATPKGDTAFLAELIHSKVVGIRDINYIHDILRYDGSLLYGESYKDRYARLAAMLGPHITASSDIGDYDIINANTWLAKNFTSGFTGLATKLDKPEDEGLVFKDPNSIFIPNPQGWAVKYRKPTKNYGF